MDFRQIHYVIALYDEKSITKAARRLHVVQPAVSMQIRRIEEEYGTILFDRTTTGVFPNARAGEIYPLCIEILERAAAVRRKLRNVSGKITGALSVGVPPWIARGSLALQLRFLTAPESMSFHDSEVMDDRCIGRCDA